MTVRTRCAAIATVLVAVAGLEAVPAFAADTRPPAISAVSATPAPTSATVRWTTNEPANSRVDFGSTTAYGANVADPVLVKSHSVLVAGLACASTYHYKVTSADGSRNSASSVDATFTTASCPPPGAGPVSDDFAGSSLDTTRWRFVNPMADGTVGVSAGHASLYVPAGSNHDTWTPLGAQSAAILQNIANVDFQVTAKFDSLPAVAYQTQGILVEADGLNLERFEILHDGNMVKLFTASLEGATTSPTVHLSAPMTSSNSVWLRVQRVGSAWTESYSTNGSTFTTAVSYNRSLAVASVGVYAGNSGVNGGPAPAYTASVDSFISTSLAPDTTPPTISGVSSTASPTSATVTWTTDEVATSRVDYGLSTAYGATVADPALVMSHTAALSGLACATTYHFTVSSVDQASNTASTADATFATTACPPPDTTPPTISGVSATPAPTSATVTWTTNEPANSRVDHGSSTAYGATAADPALVTSHTVMVTGLLCAATYHFKVTSVDGSSNSASSVDATFTTSACPPSGAAPVSDDFSGASLDTTRWSFVNPKGDGTVSVGGGRAVLNVPGGTDHDTWTPNGAQSVAILQSVSDLDFDVTAKFITSPTTAYQTEGIVAEADGLNLERFEILHDGGAVKLFTASLAGATTSPTVRVNAPLSISSGPIWLRVRRTGSTWTESYSTDGATFTTVVSYSRALTVTRLGPYAGNAAAGSNPAPAFTASVDSFTSGALAPDTSPPIISGVSAAPSPTSASVTWTTDEPATSRLDYGPTTAYGAAAADPAMVTSHTVTVTGLTCASSYHYKVTSVDPASNSASTVDRTFATSACVPPDAVPVSDDFSAAALNTSRWNFVNPKGDATVSTNGTQAVISVPGSTSHYVWTNGAEAPRLMENVSDGDFDIEAKFQSTFTAATQIQGILVEQDSSRFIRFDLSRESGGLTLAAASVMGSTGTAFFVSPVRGGPDIYLRVSRRGTAWSFSYSYDGLAWTSKGSYNQGLTVSRVGLFAGNNGSPAPAFTAKADFFVNRAAPPSSEDGAAFPPPSAPPSIDVWYGSNQSFGSRGRPQQWVNILGKVSDADGVYSLKYSLNGGAEQFLWLGENSTRLVNPGDFNVELDYSSLVSGANTVRLTATDTKGNQTVRTVTATYTSGVTAPANYSITWSTSTPINTVAQVVDGRWEVQSDGTVRTLETGYDRLIALGDMSAWTNYEVTARVTINSLGSGGAVGLLAGWKGHTTDNYGVPLPDQPRIGHPFPAFAYYGGETTLRLAVASNTPQYQEVDLATDTSGKTLTPGTAYQFKLRVTTNASGGSLFSFKVWQASQPEPSAWDLQVNGDRSQGAVILAAHQADISFGTVSVVGL